jgi:ribosome-binding ATPase YchF (GTP1/OBG family)
VRGASEGAGLGNAFLSHVAAVDGLFHVVRAFDNDEVVHVDDSVDPVRDLETIQVGAEVVVLLHCYARPHASGTNLLVNL